MPSSKSAPVTAAVGPFGPVVPRWLATFLFVGLLATVVVLNQSSRRQSVSAGAAGASAASLDPAEALRRYGFSLTESSRQMNIDFRHEAPVLDAKLAPIMPRIADMGAGVAVADFDQDGYQDFYLTTSAIKAKNALYRNRGDGTFENVADTLHVADVNQDGTGVSMGAVWGDYDNDGFPDLLVYKWGKVELFHNDRGKNFTRVTDTANLPRWMNANTAIWWDYNRDGKLDLYLGGYFDESLDLFHLKTTQIMPDSLEYATNGTRKYVLRGNGDGTFTDVTEQLGITTKSWNLAAASADLDADGFPELYLANDYGVNELWKNSGGTRFVNIGKEAGVGSAPKAGMNVSFGDVLNEGRFAIYVSNITEPGLLNQGNNLWVPRADSKKLLYDNQAGDMNVELGGWSFGAQFGDLNNDGFQDLYLVNGYISADQKRSYWYDYSKVSGGNALIVRDTRNWPPLDGRSLSGFQQKRVWINDGAGRFNDVALPVGVTDRYDGRGVALADLDNNGTLDVIVANQNGPTLVYKNSDSPSAEWVSFKLQGDGVHSNRDAIGALVTLYWANASGEMRQVQTVSGGTGFCAQNQRPLHFGLGKDARIEKVQIRWPSGNSVTLPAPKMGEMHTISENESATRTAKGN